MRRALQSLLRDQPGMDRARPQLLAAHNDIRLGVPVHRALLLRRPFPDLRSPPHAPVSPKSASAQAAYAARGSVGGLQSEF
jgi:hypothetical protein